MSPFLNVKCLYLTIFKKIKLSFSLIHNERDILLFFSTKVYLSNVLTSQFLPIQPILWGFSRMLAGQYLGWVKSCCSIDINLLLTVLILIYLECDLFSISISIWHRQVKNLPITNHTNHKSHKSPKVVGNIFNKVNWTFFKLDIFL